MQNKSPHKLASLIAPGQPNKSRLFVVTAIDGKSFEDLLRRHTADVHLIRCVQGKHFVLRTTPAFVRTILLTDDVVKFIEDGERKPIIESPVPLSNLAVNAVSLVHAAYSEISGEGLKLSVKEDLFDTLDIDFAGRYLPSGFSSNHISSHATTMATIISGAGNSDPSQRRCTRCNDQQR